MPRSATGSSRRRRRARGCRRAAGRPRAARRCSPAATPDRCTTSCGDAAPSARRRRGGPRRWRGRGGGSRAARAGGSRRARRPPAPGRARRGARRWRAPRAGRARGRSRASARPRSRSRAARACGAPDRSVAASARSRARWLTTSMARRRPKTARHGAQGRLGEVGAAPRERPSDLGLRAEQQHQAVGVLADDLERGDRRAALHLGHAGARVEPERLGRAGPQPEVRGRDQPAQRRPAGAPAGEQHHARVARVDLAAAARRGAPAPGRGDRRRSPRCARPRVGPRPSRPAEVRCTREPSPPDPPPPRPAPDRRRGHDGVHREVEAEDRRDPGVAAGEDEADRAVEAVAVGERERVLPELGRARHERRRAARAVAQRVAGGDVQVHEGIGGHGAAAVGDRWGTELARAAYDGMRTPTARDGAGRRGRCGVGERTVRRRARSRWCPAAAGAPRRACGRRGRGRSRPRARGRRPRGR